MVALRMRFILMVNFQIVLMATPGITLPLNTMTTKIESFKTLAPNVNTPSELEATPMIQAYSSTEPESYCKSVQVPTLNVLKVGNSFNVAQSYDEECALKYGLYNEMSLPPKANSAQNLSTKESTEYLADFILPSSTSILNLPLKVSSVVKPLESLSVKPTITKFDPFVSSSFDSSNILSLTDSNSEFTTLPLTTFSCTLSPGSSRSALDLAKSVEASKSSKFMSPTGIPSTFLPLPVSSSSTVSKLPNFENTGTMSLTSLCSSLTSPLSVTSETISAKSSQSAGEFSCLPISPSLNSFSNLLPSSLLPSQTYYGDQIFVPTPNTLPIPLIPSSASDSQLFRSFLPTSSSVGSENPILTSPLDTNLNQYSNPTISSREHVFANKCPEIPTSTATLQTYHEFYTELIKNFMNFPSFGTKFSSSSLYRNCHSLKPFPPYSFPSSTNTLPSSILTPSPNKAPQGLDIMPISISTESNSCQNLPSYLLKSQAAPSILEDTFISSQRTPLPEFESAYELLSLNSLSSTSSLPLSSSNCLSPSHNLPFLSSASNSFSISNDISSPLLIIDEPDFRAFKRSPGDNVESKNIVPVQSVNSVEINEALLDEPNTDLIQNADSKILSPSSKFVKNLLQLIYLAEMLNNDENCDYRALNEIVSD